MDSVNLSIISLNNIINNIEEYMKITSNEELIRLELEKNLKNFFKYDYVWLNNDDKNYKIKKSLTDSFVKEFKDDKEKVSNRKIKWDGDFVRFTSEFWDRTEIQFELNSETSKFKLLESYSISLGYTCSGNTSKYENKIDKMVEYSTEEVIKYVSNKLW